MDGEPSSNKVVGQTNFDAFNSNVQLGALKTIKNVIALPADIAFHRSIDSSFAAELDDFSARVLSLTNRLLSLVATADTSKKYSSKRKRELESQDDVVDNFHSLVVDSMDQLLERTDIVLDEYLGLTKAPAIAVKLPQQTVAKAIKHAPVDPVIQHASHLAKPQLNFKRPVDNSGSPWFHTLSHKYNAKVPLGYDYRDATVDHASATLMSNHPYRYEISHIVYPERMFQIIPPVQPKPLDETSLTWVETPQAFEAMLGKLRQATEVAIDLEHHDYRSFAGFTCLMQISTREEDWVVDTLILREELEELNEIFTNPMIVKVFHGAESDIVWLQQDFNLYVVNLFDTYHASKALNFPRHGLANLLEMYCDFTSDKRYQLADWRIRPLPKDMLDYARSDTHFLLFIYDNLRNALLDRGRSRSRSGSPTGAADAVNVPEMRQVLMKSEETALKTYDAEVYDAEGGSGMNGWDTLARKWNKGAFLAGEVGVDVGGAVYRAVHGWRDGVAREEDESLRYVLPNHFLFQLAERPPEDVQALLRVFRSVPPVLRRRAKELVKVIRECVKRFLEVPDDVVPVVQREGTVVMEEQRQEGKGGGGETQSSSLWSGSTTKAVVASTSSLFGSAVRATPSVVAFSTAHSTLLGNTIHDTKPQHHPQFREIVARINSKLTIMPSVAKIVQPTKERSDLDAAAGVDVKPSGVETNVLGMQVEIPFVPAARRKVHEQAGIRVEDSIVVVGQKRKKRKKTRNVKEEKGVVGQEEEEGEDVVTMKEEEFDFNDVPNILDGDGEVEEVEEVRRKRKKQKGAMFFNGDFKAPPKAPSEVNRSFTFR